MRKNCKVCAPNSPTLLGWIGGRFSSSFADAAGTAGLMMMMMLGSVEFLFETVTLTLVKPLRYLILFFFFLLGYFIRLGCQCHDGVLVKDCKG